MSHEPSYENRPGAHCLVCREEVWPCKVALTAERDALQKQLDTLSHNYRVSFEREQQLTEELNDLTMAIVHLFSPATARRIYNLRALGERS